jgi:inhibitor of the pro-sigma K processing machinery
MEIEFNVIIAYVVGIIFLFILGRVLLFPMKVLLKLIYNAIIGGIVIVVINLIGGLFQFNIALNIVSAFVVGVLGVPGIILLIALKALFGG